MPGGQVGNLPHWFFILLLVAAHGARPTRDFTQDSVVRIRGLEPPLPCENVDLNHARLPIPPYPLEMTFYIITWKSEVPK